MEKTSENILVSIFQFVFILKYLVTVCVCAHVRACEGA